MLLALYLRRDMVYNLLRCTRSVGLIYGSLEDTGTRQHLAGLRVN